MDIDRDYSLVARYTMFDTVIFLMGGKTSLCFFDKFKFICIILCCMTQDLNLV